jgi:class 3 adenylate cyclase
MRSARRPEERTVTLLLTDIEGSTRALQRLGPRYVDALDEHRRILRRITSDFGGTEVDAVGDSLLFAFDNATAAAGAAVFGQLALAAMGDRSPEAFRVRMGIHSGPLWRRKGKYYGLTLHKVARISGLARGGQILLSCETSGALGARAPIRQVGTAILDGFDSPEEVYELCVTPSLLNGAEGSPR